MDVQVIQGDMTDASADAMVSPDRTNLRMATGVAAALRRTADGPINREAASQGPLELGETVVTDAYALDAEYVIHAVAMPHFGGGGATEASIRDATANSLRTAEELDGETLAMPVIGTNVGEFPFEEGARIVMDGIAGFVAESLTETQVIASADSEYETLQEIADETG